MTMVSVFLCHALQAPGLSPKGETPGVRLAVGSLTISSRQSVGLIDLLEQDAPATSATCDLLLATIQGRDARGTRDYPRAGRPWHTRLPKGGTPVAQLAVGSLTISSRQSVGLIDLLEQDAPATSATISNHAFRLFHKGWAC